MLTLVDAGGNTADDDTSTLLMTLETEPAGSPTLSGTNPVSFSNGNAAFSDLSLNVVGVYTLRATASPSGLFVISGGGSLVLLVDVFLCRLWRGAWRVHGGYVNVCCPFAAGPPLPFLLTIIPCRCLPRLSSAPETDVSIGSGVPESLNFVTPFSASTGGVTFSPNPVVELLVRSPLARALLRDFAGVCLYSSSSPLLFASPRSLTLFTLPF